MSSSILCFVPDISTQAIQGLPVRSVIQYQPIASALARPVPIKASRKPPTMRFLATVSARNSDVLSASIIVFVILAMLSPSDTARMSAACTACAASAPRPPSRSERDTGLLILAPALPTNQGSRRCCQSPQRYLLKGVSNTEAFAHDSHHGHTLPIQC